MTSYGSCSSKQNKPNPDLFANAAYGTVVGKTLNRTYRLSVTFLCLKKRTASVYSSIAPLCVCLSPSLLPFCSKFSFPSLFFTCTTPQEGHNWAQ